MKLNESPSIPAYERKPPAPQADDATPAVVSPPWDWWDVHLAESCRKVYRPRPEVEAWLHAQGATYFQWIECRATSTQGAAYCLNGRGIIVFRGTQQLFDWLTDLLCWYAASPPQHFGFWLAWQSVKSQVQNWAVAHPGLPLLIAGHSLGGALATLAAFDLTKTGKVERVTTFGSPRVGAPEFAQAYAKRGLAGVTRRFVHVEDGVTIVPPVGPFLAVGEKIALARPLERDDLPRLPGVAAPESASAEMGRVFWTVGLNIISPVLGNVITSKPELIDRLPNWASPHRASLLRKDWSGWEFFQLLVMLAFLALPFLAVYIAFHPLASETAVLAYLNRAAVARAVVTAFLSLMTQQAAYVLAWKCPFVVRFPLSLAAGVGAYRWLALDRAGVGHAWGVVLMALALSMVLYRVLGGVVDHPMENYVVALGGRKDKPKSG